MSEQHVFISYSHHDEAIKDRLVSFLSVGRLRGALEVWNAKDIPAGVNWKTEVEAALGRAAVGVLLISPDYLASQSTQEELDSILARREARNFVMVPIIARPCLWHLVAGLRTAEVFPKDGGALSMLTRDGIDAVLSEVAEKILSSWEAVNARAEQFPLFADRYEEFPEVDLSFLTDPDPDPAPETRKPVFFISHSHDDGDFAEILKNRIEAHGYQAWIDLERLEPGTDWREGIDTSIRNCTALIVVMSPTARSSEYVTYEWAFAWGSQIKVIPVMLHQTALHPRLETLQYLDFTNRAARPWSQLFRTLNECVKKKP